MKWARRVFAPPERKSGWVGRQFSGLGGEAGGGEPPASYAARAAAAMRCATGYRAMRLVSEGLASVQLHAGGEEHPALALPGIPFGHQHALAKHFLEHLHATLPADELVGMGDERLAHQIGVHQVPRIFVP